MEALLEFLFELLFELLLQVVIEVLWWLGWQGVLLLYFLFRSVSEPFRAPQANRGLTGMGYLIFGAAAGGFSLLPFPRILVRAEWGRWLNLVLTPLLAGSVMSLLDPLLRRRGRALSRREAFIYGMLFALAMAAVRFAFGK